MENFPGRLPARPPLRGATIRRASAPEPPTPAGFHAAASEPRAVSPALRQPRVSLRSAALLFAANSGFVARCRGGTCHKFAAVARQAVFKAKRALLRRAAPQSELGAVMSSAPPQSAAAAREGIGRRPFCRGCFHGRLIRGPFVSRPEMNRSGFPGGPAPSDRFMSVALVCSGRGGRGYDVVSARSKWIKSRFQCRSSLVLTPVQPFRGIKLLSQRLTYSCCLDYAGTLRSCKSARLA